MHCSCFYRITTKAERPRPQPGRVQYKASFAIREPQPAGLSLKASLQQLRGTTNCSQANRDREKSADDVIISNAGEEQQPQYKFLPSASQAAVQTPTQAPGIIATEIPLHTCMLLLLSIPRRSFQPSSRSDSWLIYGLCTG